MSVELSIENIGGFNKPMTMKFKKGLNRIRASNGTGKTSLTRALELLALPSDKLKGKGHYSNLYAGSEEEIRVSLSGDLEFQRRFRRIGKDTLDDLGNPPLSPSNRGHVIDACFAIPGNPLLESFESGKSVREYIESLAGSSNYERASSIIQEMSQNTKSKVQHYRDLMIRLDEIAKQRKDTDERIKALREDFVKMPLMDESEVFDDIGKFNRKKQSLDAENEKISEAKIKISDLSDSIESLKDDIKRLDDQMKLIRTRSPKIDSRLSELAAVIPERENEFEKIRRERAKEEEKLSTARKNELDISKYGGNFCFACGQELSPIKLSSWMDKIKRAISDLEKSELGKRRDIEDLRRERETLKTSKNELATKEDELKKKQKSLASRESDMRKFEESLKEFIKGQTALMAEIKELSKSQDAYEEFKKREGIKQEIDQKSSEIKLMEQRMQDLKGKTSGAEKLENMIDFLENLRNFLDSRKNQIVEEVRARFNDNVTDLYQKLGFKDFNDIEIRPDFRVSVTRVRDGNYVEDFPLEALSTSERVTIGIVFLLTAKQEYVSDFPFFILDELVTSYDPGRFDTVKKYLSKQDAYVILTELANDIEEVEVIAG